MKMRLTSRIDKKKHVRIWWVEYPLIGAIAFYSFNLAAEWIKAELKDELKGKLNEVSVRSQ
jgi:hypothetical protein